MKSKKKPQKIFFNNFDSVYQLEKPLEKISFIFKIGDDLRQDCLILQILKIMDTLWKQNGKKGEPVCVSSKTRSKFSNQTKTFLAHRNAEMFFMWLNLTQMYRELKL